MTYNQYNNNTYGSQHMEGENIRPTNSGDGGFTGKYKKPSYKKEVTRNFVSFKNTLWISILNRFIGYIPNYYEHPFETIILSIAQLDYWILTNIECIKVYVKWDGVRRNSLIILYLSNLNLATEIIIIGLIIHFCTWMACRRIEDIAISGREFKGGNNTNGTWSYHCFIGCKSNGLFHYRKSRLVWDLYLKRFQNDSRFLLSLGS